MTVRGFTTNARPGTKRFKAEEINFEMTHTKQGKVRKILPENNAIKARFIKEIGMTKPQAATYLHNIQHKKWS